MTRGEFNDYMLPLLKDADALTIFMRLLSRAAPDLPAELQSLEYAISVTGACSARFKLPDAWLKMDLDEVIPGTDALAVPAEGERTE